MTTRTRIAPSPTGYFHLGTARAALYNWLVAHQQGGVMILRIEDTDAERGREEWVRGIEDSLSWLGLGWDEGPYRQSERLDLHVAAAQRLYAEKHAYYCGCTRSELEERLEKSGLPPRYDGFCRHLDLGPGPGRALRFAVPPEGATVVSDLVRGEVSFPNADIEDFVITRSSGLPLFILSNVVDDLDMEVSDVIRGEEHLPNTPKYQLLWRALGSRPLPRFAHLPLLVNEKRQKLSKRRDPVALESYREEGYLPEALVNHLALLGWGPEDGNDVLSIDDLLASFSIERVNHSPAFFDPAKLRHFNGIWIRRMALDDFVAACAPFLAKGPWPPEHFEPAEFERMAPLVQERVATLSEVVAMVDFLFLQEPPFDQWSWQKAMGDAQAVKVLEGTIRAFDGVPWQADDLEAALRNFSEGFGLPLRRTQAPVRVALTGRTVGPPLFQSMEVLGRPRTIGRLQEAIEKLRREGSA